MAHMFGQCKGGVFAASMWGRDAKSDLAARRREFELTSEDVRRLALV